jgi:hypothetical protein
MNSLTSDSKLLANGCVTLEFFFGAEEAPLW